MIDQVRESNRCVRAPNLRAVTAQKRTISVRFRLSSAAPVKFSLERWTGKRGASKAPAGRSGKPKSGGRKIAGVYSPQAGRSVNARAGVNTVTVAATGRKGKRLRPGTYLLTVTSGDVTARTKIWVLANEANGSSVNGRVCAARPLTPWPPCAATASARPACWRPAEVEALSEVEAQAEQLDPRGLVLDTLGDDLQAEAVPELELTECTHRRVALVGGHPHHE